MLHMFPVARNLQERKSEDSPSTGDSEEFDDLGHLSLLEGPAGSLCRK